MAGDAYQFNSCPEAQGRRLGHGSRLNVKGQDYELLLFGSGRRMHPAYSLGLKVIQMSLANLLQGLVWSLSDGLTKEEFSMEEIFGMSTPGKFPLRLKLLQNTEKYSDLSQIEHTLY